MSVITPAVEVSNLFYSYESNLVLDHISFTIKTGSYVGLIGPNGGGKTTLLKILLGLIEPFEGEVKIFGKPLNNLERTYEIGYVPQRVVQENLQFPATVYEVVASGRTPRLKMGMGYSAEDVKCIEKALKIAGITRLRDKQIRNLSGGERQRAYVARALAAEPRLLLLDEPFTGVDVASQQNFYDLLSTLNKEHGLTIIFVSHDIDVISKEVKELLCLNKRLVCQGSPHTVIEKNIIESLYGKRITHIHRDHHH